MITLAFEDRKALGLQYVLDLLSPETPYGAERVRRFRFYRPSERALLEAEWANVAAALDGLEETPEAYARLKRLFMQIRDIRGTLSRMADSVLFEVELFEIKRFLLQLAQIAPLFAQIGGAYQGISFTEEKDALALLDPEGARAAGFAISSAYAAPLQAAREEKRRLETALRGQTDRPERDRLMALRREVCAREEAETLKVRKSLTESLLPHREALLKNAEMIGRLDFAIQRALLARDRKGTRPRVSQGHAVFQRMEYPEVADALAGRGQAFTRVSIDAPPGVTAITGANMGGKSVAIKALVLNVLLCHAGFYALAEEARLPLFDAVYAVVEDHADAAKGLSSFGAEVQRLGEILRAVSSGAHCLIALDEPARGTNPEEGAALVKALTETLSAYGSVTVIATHFDGVARHAKAHYQAAGLRNLPDPLPEGDRLALLASHMDYGLERIDLGAKPPREALRIARLLGLDEKVLDRMEQSLGKL